MTNSILLVGVGGLGTILASKLLTIGLMEAGYSVKMSEIHGMSQRGGSVSTHVRYSKDTVYSPVMTCFNSQIMFFTRFIKVLKPHTIIMRCNIWIKHTKKATANSA